MICRIPGISFFVSSMSASSIIAVKRVKIHRGINVLS